MTIDENILYNVVESSFQEIPKILDILYSSDDFIESLEEMVSTICDAFIDGKKLMIIGNGGSAADSQHFAAELVNRFKIGRFPLPAIALTTDSSVLTSISNDFGFDEVFSKQVNAIGNPGDVLFCISTSGTSENIKNAINTAKDNGIITLGLTGGNSFNNAIDTTDCFIYVDTTCTPRIQELHIMIIHILCELIERAMTDYFTQN